MRNAKRSVKSYLKGINDQKGSNICEIMQENASALFVYHIVHR